MFEGDSSPRARASGAASECGTARFWKEIVAPLDPFLAQVRAHLVAQADEFEPEVASHARYVMGNEGKQLRPLLLALSGGATGHISDGHAQVAVIIEMVHLATLVHDDVMDGASLRRGRPTAAAKWGNEVSILLGDCLFAHALKLAASFPTPEICRSVAAATNRVCTGEVLQTLRGGGQTRAEYFRQLELKTGELFALSCRLGAVLNGAEARKADALGDYGRTFGIAYQIFDDCLDLVGSEDAAGKSLGTDLAHGKRTLPLLVAQERVSGSAGIRLQAVVETSDVAELPWVQDLLESSGALEECTLVIDQWLDQARARLAVLDPSVSRTALRQLTDFLASRAGGLRSRRPEDAAVPMAAAAAICAEDQRVLS
jgi:octaprenyl-diphosphate synthase